jgi:hypothetical protein
MKMQVQYCESFRTFLKYGTYSINSENFPELENLDHEYVTQWISENMESLSVRDDEDGNREIVPYDSNLSDLQTDSTESGVQREKIIDNDAWFEYLDEDSEEESED